MSYFMPPSKKEGNIVFLLSVGQPDYHQFPFIFLAKVVPTELKFGIQIYHLNVQVKFDFEFPFICTY